MSLNRRDFLKQAGVGGGVLLFGSGMITATGMGKEGKLIEAGKHQNAIKKIII